MERLILKIRFIDVENLVKEEAYALGLEPHMSLDSYNNRYDEGGEIRESMIPTGLMPCGMRIRSWSWL